MRSSRQLDRGVSNYARSCSGTRFVPIVRLQGLLLVKIYLSTEFLKRFENTMKLLRLFAVTAITAFSAACATVGHEFPVDGIKRLQNGVTTQAQARDWFGEPWRVGWEDGLRTWTYGHYRYSLFSPAQTRDLLLRFDPQGILRSYSYNTTETGKR
jgi:hypothetical protein